MKDENYRCENLGERGAGLFNFGFGLGEEWGRGGAIQPL